MMPETTPTTTTIATTRSAGRDLGRQGARRHAGRELGDIGLGDLGHSRAPTPWPAPTIIMKISADDVGTGAAHVGDAGRGRDQHRFDHGRRPCRR